MLVWSFLLSLSFYPEWFGFLAWFSLIRPLMIISSLSGRPAFNAAYFYGFFFSLFCTYWVALVTVPGMIAVVVIVAFYYAASLTIFQKLYRIKPLLGLIMLPIVWVGQEHFRTLSEFAFPWSDLGYSQSYYLYILQSVSVISVHGLSLLIVAVNVLLWQVLRKSLPLERRVTCLLSACSVIVALMAYGWVVLPPYPEPGTYRLALLQGSVPLEVKWADGNRGHSIRLYDSLATKVVDDSTVSLFIWPETAAPCYPSHQDWCRNDIARVAKNTGSYHLVGGMGAGGSSDELRHYNSCYQFNPEGRIDKRHDKVMLVPFAEHVPYQDYVPFLHQKFIRKYLTFLDRWNIQWWSDYFPGDSSVLFRTPQAAYSVLICFETAFPEYVRQMILNGAEFIIGITNDTWFGATVGIHMHSRMFVTRAVENRCWFARSANSGLTYIVDPFGRIRGELELYEVAALIGEVGLLDSYSLFTRFGDLAGRWSFLITLLSAGILILRWMLRRFQGTH